MHHQLIHYAHAVVPHTLLTEAAKLLSFAIHSGMESGLSVMMAMMGHI